MKIKLIFGLSILFSMMVVTVMGKTNPLDYKQFFNRIGELQEAGKLTETDQMINQILEKDKGNIPDKYKKQLE